jgi:hypothetical protein
MSLEDLLRVAVESVCAGRDGLLEYEFNTPEGAVRVLADIVLEKDTIICKNLCIYAASDPPGIKKATIARELLCELRALQKPEMPSDTTECMFKESELLVVVLPM